MTKFFLIAWLLVPGVLAAENSAALEKSVVTIEVTRKFYEYMQPWSRRVDQAQKTAVVLAGRELLTTAEGLADRTLIRVQKGGRGKWWKAEAKWVDYHANLALLTVEDPAFWQETKSLEIADAAPAKGEVQIARWRNGNLDERKAEVSRLSLKRSRTSFLEYLQMEIESEAPSLGFSDIILSKGKIAGLAAGKEEHGCAGIPASLIKHCLKGAKAPKYPGLGYFAFVWQRGENPATLDYLKLKGEHRGVVIISVPEKAADLALQPRDIILEVDGFKIDTQGNFKDPAYGNISLENLATKQHWAGDEIKLTVWRDGKSMDVKYKLPKAEYNIELVPEELFDQEPEYLMIGGLLFQPLTEPYLRSWGADWIRKAPFRLSYYTREKDKDPGASLIILSLVLPDPVNLGYQDSRFLAVDTFNGRKIKSLKDLLEARTQPKDGLHIVEFRDGDAVKRIVLDAAEAEQATQRIQQRYGIAKAYYVADAPPAPPLTVR